MQGYQLTFYTQQNRRVGQLTVAEWLLHEARELGFTGATMTAAQAGFGRDGKIYAARFIELAEQPMEVTMALSVENSARLFARIKEEKVSVFYVKIPVEFGVTGEE